ncbi:uncharacterized protein PG998_006848 [Apiospora kogelbergensis]|uniref:uncharacterized protein n=1 Tax=Apiospora kogelbergensis TaxID=1337665 RepID=UPI00313284FF
MFTRRNELFSIALQSLLYISSVWGFISFIYFALGLENKGARFGLSSPPSPSLTCHAPSLLIDSQFQPDPYHPETLESGLNLCDCGRSIAEAKTKDCVYDALATAWLPPHCRDDELTKKFEAAGDWKYFADKEGTVLLTIEQVAALGDHDGVFWTSRFWHVAHCVFYWQKYRRIRMTGLVMEERYDELHHSVHCSGLILNSVPDHAELIPVPVTLNSSLIAGNDSLRKAVKLVSNSTKEN